MEGIEEKRVCAFIDILGFGQAMMSDDAVRRRDLIALVKQLGERQSRHGHHTQPLSIGWISYPSANVTSFSDNVVLSHPLRRLHWQTQVAGQSVSIPFKPTKFLEHVFAQIVRAVWDGLHLGVLFRGAVVVDRLYHAGDVVAGRALVRAVEMERDTCMPRIELAPAVLDVETEDGRLLIPDSFKDACILKRDGKWMFDVAGFHAGLWREYAHEEQWVDPTRSDALERAEEVQSLIAKKVEHHREQSPAKVAEKWEWFQAYFDDAISSGRWEEIRGNLDNKDPEGAER